jgi:hypothetical protein
MVEDQQTFQADRAALDHHGGFENVKILARASISPPGARPGAWAPKFDDVRSPLTM